MLEEKKLSEFISLSKKLQVTKFEKKIKVAILGSYTLNGLEETIRVKCAENKIQCSTYVGDYNQYNQEILKNDSMMYKFSPDVTFLILDTRSILGDLFFSPYSVSKKNRKEFIQNKIDEISSLVSTFVNNTKSKLIITNFNVPTYSPHGIYESKIEYGIKKMVIDLNDKLEGKLKDEPSVYVYDFNGFITNHGEKNVFDHKQYFFGDIKISLNYIPYFANELMGYIKSILGLNKRCIVLDLDNTLWGGIVGEDGFEGIKLGDNSIGKAFVEFQKQILALHNRGIVLAINSKNNFEDAIKVIKEHPNMILREEHFGCLKINWKDKLTNFKEISTELNFGLENMVFFDDDPVNRELIRTSIPEVLVVDLPKDPSFFASTLMSINDFHVLKITNEDVKRGQMYVQQRQRSELKTQSNNLDDFLKQLEIKIRMKEADEFTIPRISQLTLKTNQFNLTTKRYQEEDIRNFSKNKNKIIGCAQVEDKFGDNGVTGAYIINKDNADEWTIDTFLLSCRVIGRGIEDGILDYIIKKAKESGVKKISGEFIPTKKNKPAEDFLSKFGFTKENDHWIYQVDNHVKKSLQLEMIIE